MPHPFTVTVTELPAITLVGMSVRTSYATAAQDCPKLWMEDFMPHLHKLACAPANEFQGASYGISVMTGEEGVFDYWAAAPKAEQASVPQGMSSISLSGGLYACCPVPSMAQIGDAYTFMYSTWSTLQNEYAITMQAPCFERYDEAYLANGSFEMYVPVVKA